MAELKIKIDLSIIKPEMEAHLMYFFEDIAKKLHRWAVRDTNDYLFEELIAQNTLVGWWSVCEPPTGADELNISTEDLIESIKILTARQR